MNPGTKGHLAMLAFSALVAGSFSLGARMANDITPEAFTAVRFVLGAALVGVLAFSRGPIGRENLAAPWRYFILGGLFATYFVLMFEGLKTAPPVSAAAVFTLVPAMAAVFAWFLLRQITTSRMALALSVGGIGALWVIFRADLAALRAFDIGRGEAIYFIGCVCHAIYTPMVRRLNRGENVIIFTFGMLVAGSILLLIYAWSDLRTVVWSELPMRVWVTLIYVAVFATAVTTVLVQFAALRLPSAKVMAYTYLTPTWVIVWEFFLGNGVPTVYILGGVALTATALLLLLHDEGG